MTFVAHCASRKLRQVLIYASFMTVLTNGNRSSPEIFPYYITKLRHHCIITQFSIGEMESCRPLN